MKTHNYCFIDSQNLNLGVRSQGWKLDWRKKDWHRRSVETLSLSSHRDMNISPQDYEKINIGEIKICH